MLTEEQQLQALGVSDAFERLTISEDALVVTLIHAAANQLRELARGEARHGSCGVGVGEAMKDSLEHSQDLVIRVRDLLDKKLLREKLLALQSAKREELRTDGVIDLVRHIREAAVLLDELWDAGLVELSIQDLDAFLAKAKIVPDAYLSEILAKDGSVIFEPAQGVLLDEWRGFHPYTTWATCTFDNVHTLLAEHGYDGQVHRLGILRAYATRHGAGPFVTEDAGLTSRLPDTTNETDAWQGDFRVGHFDAVAARYAINCCGGRGVFDGLVITCVDRLESERELRICTAYDITAVEEACEDYFAINGSGITFNMKLGEFQDLGYQEGLTRRLKHVRPMFRCQPNTGAFEDVGREHLLHIQEELRVPIVLTSWGPTLKDKRWEASAAFLLGQVAQVA